MLAATLWTKLRIWRGIFLDSSKRTRLIQLKIIRGCPKFAVRGQIANSAKPWGLLFWQKLQYEYILCWVQICLRKTSQSPKYYCRSLSICLFHISKNAEYYHTSKPFVVKTNHLFSTNCLQTNQPCRLSTLRIWDQSNTLAQKLSPTCLF